MTTLPAAARRILAAVALAAAAWCANAVAEEVDHQLYASALARERAIRATFPGTPAREAALKDIHSIVTAYQTLVRRFPASSYSDDALWQAGRLELDAFARFGEARDRENGVRLLHRLLADYPASKLAKRVPDTLAALEKPVTPAAALSIISVRSVKRIVLPDVVRVVLELDGEVPFRDERLADPDRVSVELAASQPAPSLADQTLRFASDADIVRQLRVGKSATRTTRVVFDASGVSTYSIYALYDPFRLVIDCVRGPHPAPSLPLTGRGLLVASVRKLPPALPRSTPMQIALATAAAESAALPPTSATAVAAAPERNTTGGFSMARQLGLGVSRIVIDPGHGGHDPGAMGNGVSEAELVLDVALRLEQLLRKLPGTDVALTRRTDEFVSLPERTAIANRESADLFLSIHANASEDASARGVETYFLNFANNLSAASVAARENAASGQAMGALPDFVKAIALNNKLDESRDFATYIQRAMIERLRLTNKTTKDLGVRQAPFVVLIGAAMPSVLAEISFVTNPQEARLLRSSAFRQRIAEALFTAIKRYQTSLVSGRSVATVAHGQ
jgi:N-acetylmuramoyl-L-alanine amidase